MYTPGLPFTGDTLKERSLGGSETAALYIAKELAKRGHKITHFTNCAADQSGKYDGVEYMSMRGDDAIWGRWVASTPHDVTIIQRNWSSACWQIFSKVRFLWQHDLALHHMAAGYRGVVWNLDKVCVVSEFMRRQYAKVTGTPEDGYAVTRNGINLGAMPKPLPWARRKQKLLVYAARPERGMDLLLEKVMPRLLKADPEIRLTMAGYDNYVPHLQHLYERCQAATAALGKSAEHVGALKQADLHKLYSEAALYVYPSLAFHEVHCCHGDTLVDMPRDYRQYPNGVPIRELVGRSGFPVYCYDFKNHRITLGTVKWVKKTRCHAPIHALTIDNGSILKATGDHPICMRDETWRRLDQLRPGDSLMPLYNKAFRVDVNLNAAITKHNGKIVRSIGEHQLVAEWKNGRRVRSKEHADHINGNSWDNRQENIQLLSHSEHMKKTSVDAVASGRIGNPMARKRNSQNRRAFFQTQEGRRQVRENLGATGGRALWAKFSSPEEREAFCRQREEGRSEEANAVRLANLARWNHKVVSVEPAGYADVYDMEVEEHHNFVANGIVVHNCISAAEAQACGLPMVCSGIGALPETLGEAGTFVECPDGEFGSFADPDAYADAFCEKVFGLLRDPVAWQMKHEAGLRRAQDMDWSARAAEWEAISEEALRKGSGDRKRLALHFLRRSDVMMARHLAEAEMADRATADAITRAAEAPPDAPPLFDTWPEQVINEIARRYPWLGSRGKTAAFYEAIVGKHSEAYTAGRWAYQEPRLHVLMEELRKYPDTRTLTDFGCAHGGYVVALANEFQQLAVTGIDISPTLIRYADQLKEADCARKSAIRFKVGTEDELPAIEPADALVCFEVLEHVACPWDTLQKIEKLVCPGGLVFLTVPYGPWDAESLSHDPNIPVCHLWEIERADLEDMVGHRRGFSLRVIPRQRRHETEESPASYHDDSPMGWLFASYRRDDQAVRPIDMERKRRQQNPRETVALCVIVKDGAAHLKAMLESVRDLPDELIVGDTGSRDRTLEIVREWAEAHPVVRTEIFAASDPLAHGFETPRNETVARARTDWILWLDADEELRQHWHVGKYLRPNMHGGYSIKQHHFSVHPEHATKIDLPVRLFRHGRGIRFFGCLAGDTPISTTRGQVPIKDLVGTRPWVYCYDHAKCRISLAQADWVGMTRQRQRLLEIELDDGTRLRATPEHPFLLRKTWKGVQPGSYVPASQLQAGDRLMPFYRWQDGRVKDQRRGWMVGLRGTGMAREEHRFVYEETRGPVPKGHHVHHRDLNPANNDPLNLEAMPGQQHRSLHHKGKVLSRETRARISENHAPCDGPNNSMYGRRHTKATKAAIGKKSQERGAGYGNAERGWFTTERVQEMNRQTWADPAVRAKRISGIRRARLAEAAARSANHRVVAVRDGGVADVYNIEMPGPNHNFAAGGVIVHNCIHEHPETAINAGAGYSVVIGDCGISHVGYLDERSRRRRFFRNFGLLLRDRERYPDRILGRFLWLRDCVHLMRYVLRNPDIVQHPVLGDFFETVYQAHGNGEPRTPETLARIMAELGIQEARDHFLESAHAMTDDSISYMSECVAFLNRGFEVKIPIAVSKERATIDKESIVIWGRFADYIDLEKHVCARLKAVVEPLIGPYSV